MSLANHITRASNPLMAGMVAISIGAIVLTPTPLTPRAVSAPRIALAAGVLPGLPALPDLGIGATLAETVKSVDFVLALGGTLVGQELALNGVPVALYNQPYILTNDLISPIGNEVGAAVGAVVDGRATLPDALGYVGSTVGAALGTTLQVEQQVLGNFSSAAQAVQQLHVNAAATPNASTVQPAALPGLPNLGIGAGLAETVGRLNFDLVIVTELAGAALANNLGVPTALAGQPLLLENNLIAPVTNAIATDGGAVIDGGGTVPQALTGIVGTVGAALGATLKAEQQALGGLSALTPAVQQLRTNAVAPAAISHTPTALSDTKTTTDPTKGDKSSADNRRPRHARSDDQGPRHAGTSDGKHANHTTGGDSGSGGTSSGRHARS